MKSEARTWDVWVCPGCDEIVMRAGIDGHCAGSLTEQTAHDDVPMVPSTVIELAPVLDLLKALRGDDELAAAYALSDIDALLGRLAEAEGWGQ